MGYKLKCAREISDIVKKNKIKNEEINIGDKLKLYPPLLEKSKIRFDNKGEYHQIKEFFDPHAGWYSLEMQSLAYSEEFTVYDKKTTKDNIRNKESYQVRINPKRPDFDLFQKWVNIKYFSKK